MTAQAAPRPITVVVVDDNAIVRLGVRSLLGQAADIHVAGEAWDGETALSVVRQLLPDVVLLDVRMPRRDGVGVAQEIAGMTAVVMLTYSEAPEVVQAAVSAGARGYLVHGQFGPDELLFAVRSAARGGGVFSAPALAALGAAPAAPGAPVRPDRGLSAREVEVTELVAAGRTNAEIARALFLSEKTVKNHVNHIFAKLGVQTRAQATSLWLGGHHP
ncbi:MAG TPA: response regulator transcription factor [Actinomycetales bacterium]